VPLLKFPSPTSTPPLRFLAAPPANPRMVRSTVVTCATASTGNRAPRGIMKPRRVSPEMADFIGAPEVSRTQALKLIWAHIKEHNLQV
jgi:chromatin remodeling complex protein RSC6